MEFYGMIQFYKCYGALHLNSYPKDGL